MVDRGLFWLMNDMFMGKQDKNVIIERGRGGGTFSLADWSKEWRYQWIEAAGRDPPVLQVRSYDCPADSHFSVPVIDTVMGLTVIVEKKWVCKSCTNYQSNCLE